MRRITEIENLSSISVTDTKVIKREEYSVHLDARAIIDDAQERAEQIVAEAQQAKQIAYDEGYQEGFESGKKEQSDVLIKTHMMCREFMESRQEDIVDLVIAIAHKLLGDLDRDDVVMGLVERALAAHHNAHTMTLRVAPQQYALVNDQLGNLMKKFSGGGQVEVSEDNRVEPGDCLLETSIGVLNASLDTQLSAVENSLRMSLREMSE